MKWDRVIFAIDVAGNVNAASRASEPSKKKRIYDYLEEFSNSSSLAFSLTWSLFELDWLQRMQWMCVILINMSEQLNKYENNAIYHVSYCLQGRFSNSITLSMSPKWFTYNNCQRCIRRSL